MTTTHAPEAAVSLAQMDAMTAVRRLGRRAELFEKARGRNLMNAAFLLVVIGIGAFLAIAAVSNRPLALAIVGLNGAAIVWAINVVWSRIDAIVDLIEGDGRPERE